LDNIRTDYVKSCYLQFTYLKNPIHFECRRDTFSKGLHKITETAGMIIQSSADELKIKLA